MRWLTAAGAVPLFASAIVMFSAVPLLWDPFFKSLAVVIICGLSFATILTLIIVPALYTIFVRVRQDEQAET